MPSSAYPHPEEARSAVSKDAGMQGKLSHIDRGTGLLRFARNDANNRKPPSLALLSAVTALAFCGLHMVVPALPLLVLVFDDGAPHVQLVLSLYLAGIAVGQL